MKFCASCNKDFPDTVRYCGDCGAKLNEKPEAPPASAAGVSIQDGVVVGGVHITSTDRRTFISHQDDTREVLTCAGCGANVRRPNGFTCPLCGRFFCADDYDKDKKACRSCAESKADAAVRTYRSLLDDVMRDGRIDASERAQLDQARINLGLGAEQCAQLEKERRSVPASSRLGRRDQALLDEARQLVFDTLSFDEALRVVQPLFERNADNPDIRKVYLLALIEADSDRAVDVINAMRFDDLDKSMAQIEVLARLGKYDLAYQALEDARRAFGVDNPELVASEADLALEEYRRTGRKALLDVSVECVDRLPERSSEYASYTKAFLRHMKGDKQPLAELAQAGNYYAKRKKHFILNQAKPRSGTTVAAPPPEPEPEPPPKIERPAEIPQPPPPPPTRLEVPPPPPMPALVPGMWRLTLMSAWGQTFYGTCQVNVVGSNVMMVAEVSGQALLWDGLVHFFADRSIFRGSVMGVNVVAACIEAMRMVDGMAVPVPGLPIRLNAVLGDNGHSINGTVVNSLGETTRILLSI